MSCEDNSDKWASSLGAIVVLIVLASIALTASGEWPWAVKAFAWNASWLESSNAAAWVQAIGSIVAIAGTAIGTRYQVNRGHELAVGEQERREKRTLVAALIHLRGLGYSAHVQFLTINDQLKDRAAVHALADASWVDVSILQMIETQISAIPVFSLPNEVSFIPFILVAEIRRTISILEETRAKHRQMDAVAFEQYFRLIQSIAIDIKLRSDTINETCQRLQRELAA